MGELRAIKVEASAGSGKTYRLTLEYLKRLYRMFLLSQERIDPRILNSVIAITFTNKASNEMKERILKRLKAFSIGKTKGNLSDDDKGFLENLSSLSGISEDEIIKNAEPLMELILSSFADFNVKTIDSLMSSIVKVIAPELKLDPEYEIRIDSSEELSDKILAFAEKLSRENWKYMEDFLLDLFKAESFDTFSPEKKIQKSVSRLYQLSIKKDFGKIKKLDKEKLSQKLFQMLETFKNKLIEQGGLSELIDEGLDEEVFNIRTVSAAFVKALKKFEEDPKKVSTFDELINKSFFKKDDVSAFFKKNKGTESFKRLFREKYKTAKKILIEIVPLLSLYKGNNFTGFFSDFYKFWEQSKRNIYVEEFSKKIKEKLSEWEKSAPPYIYLKLSEKFYHFLIDEFQDTSELQFKALSPLINEIFSGEENSSLFIVGDRKQAIYRWRGGNAELMNEDILVREIPSLNFLEDKKLNDTLTNNFRSGKEIVNFNNDFFSPEKISQTLNEPEGISEDIKINFQNSEQLPTRNEIGYVNVKFFPVESNDKDEIESKYYEALEESIKNALKAGFKMGDIAILVRKNVYGRDIIENLSDKYDFVSDESLFLSSSAEISEIISFFKFLEYPPDNLNFYSFINGEIFRKASYKIDIEEAERLYREMEDFYLENRDKKLYVAFRERLEKLWDKLIAPFFKSVGFLPPYDIFQDFSMAYDLFKEFSDSAPFFTAFSQLLHDLEDREITSLSAFLDNWDNGNISETSISVGEAPERIKILTMHKSKGLEFPVVIIPLKEKNRSNEGGGNIFLKDKIYYIKKPYIDFDNTLNEIYNEEKRKGIIDELNLLYVAMTRAKDALFIPLVVKNKNNKKRERKLKDFTSVFKNHPIFKDWEEKKSYEFGKLEPAQIKEEKEEKEFKYSSKKIITREWQRDFLVFYPSEILKVDEKKAIDRGKKIHRVLEMIKKVESKEEMSSLIKIYGERENLKDSEIDLLLDFFTKDEVLEFFTGNFEVFNEKEILKNTENGFEIKRVDRMIVKANELIIIDYKTGEEESDEHMAQVSEYLNILNNIYPDKKKRGFLLYIESGKIKEVNI